MINLINSYINESVEIKKLFLNNNSEELKLIINLIIKCFKNKNKILVCGNGGSAADSQHFVAELVGRYKKEREALPAIALSTDTSNLTAIGNDYGFKNIFRRQVEALGNEDDILIGISTSGNSENIILAIEEARKKGMKTICLLGKFGGKIKDLCDLSIIVPSNNTPRIQEVHIMIIHIICEILENTLFDNND